jgi:hypothetical protein
MSSAIITQALAQVNGVGFSFTAATKCDGSADNTVNCVVASAMTNKPVCGSFAVAGLTLLVMTSDQDCTIKTNSATSPTNTIQLKAGKPLIWEAATAYFACPFTTDVGQLFITTTLATSLQIYGLSS